MSLIKTAATVGGWTLAYRISSFIRDILQSSIIGAGMIADAFSVAFKLANMLRKLFAEGSFNASFLPIFSNALKEKGHNEAEKIASQALTWLVLILSFLLIVCLTNFDPIMGIFAKGAKSDPKRFALSVSLGKICFPYVAASVLAALFGAILNTINKFALPAASQLIVNIAVIVALVSGPLCFPSAAHTMAWATLFAGIIQTLVLWNNVRQNGFKIIINCPWPMLEDVKNFFKKLISGALGAGIWQLNILVDISIASALPAGSVSFLYYTDHVNQLPLGILGIAFSTALLPPLTKAIKEKNTESAQNQMNFGLLFAFLFTFPAAIILISMSEAVTGAIYGRGNFGLEQVIAAAPAVAAFAFGLPCYMIQKVLSTTFFAHKDTRSPFIGGMISFFTNILFILLLMPFLKHTGIALATSLSSWLNAIYLLFTLKNLGTVKIDRKTINQITKQIIASLFMLFVILAMNTQAQYYYNLEGQARIFATLIVATFGIFAFFACGKIVGMFKFLDENKQQEI